MNEIEVLREEILKRFPFSSAVVDRPKTTTGSWWLDVKLAGKWVVVEWRPGRDGFGVSDCSTNSEEDTPFDGPDQVCDDRDAVLVEIAKVLEC